MYTERDETFRESIIWQMWFLPNFRNFTSGLISLRQWNALQYYIQREKNEQFEN